jgi:LacI family transcriptional regulator
MDDKAKTRETGAAKSPTETKRAPTMADVADLAGVSQTTVSLVLNNAVGARYADGTRKRVIEAAKTLGYRMARRGSARSASQETKYIGMIVDEISTDPWCALAIDGARETAWEYGITLQVVVASGDPEIEETALQQLTGPSMLGVIYGRILTRQVEPPAALHRIPTVLLNCYLRNRSLPSIVPGEVLGGRVATERLIAAGHRRIGIIEGEGTEVTRDRVKGYRQALSSHEILFDPVLVRPGNWEPSAGYEQTIELMRLPNPPTAIFCCNDMTALGCYDALRELGLSIPKDVSVVGYDDREIAHFTRPPLTTVLLPHREMGSLAAQFLIDGASASVRPTDQIKVECPLIERESVAAPPRLEAVAKRSRSLSH